MDKFITKMQNLTQTSKSELFVASLILLGLMIGIVVDFNKEQPKSELSNDIYLYLDSVAEAEATSYTGTDKHSNVIEELAAGDTIVKRKELFSQHTKKKEELISGKINLNTASKVELMKLPNVGEKTANKIIIYRESQPFNSIEEIKNIKGIGDAKFARMKNFIEVK